MLGKRALLEAEPMLRERGLLGGARFYDAQCDDARLTLATARSAVHHGALVANYTAVRALERTAGRVVGRADRGPAHRRAGHPPRQRRGQRHRALGRPGARARGLGRHAAAPAHQGRAHRRGPEPARLTATRSSSPARSTAACSSSCPGATSPTSAPPTPTPPRRRTSSPCRPTTSSTSSARPTPAFPAHGWAIEDVRASWAGLRPLLADRDRKATSSRSREHAIVYGAGGMITVVGGKLTTYRAMAARGRGPGRPRAAASRRPRRAPVPPGPTKSRCPAARRPTSAQFRERGLELGVAPESVEHLLRHYGTEAAGIYNLGAGERRLLRRLVPPHPAVEAEVVHAVRRELAQTVEDVMVRRIHLYLRDRGSRRVGGPAGGGADGAGAGVGRGAGGRGGGEVPGVRGRVRRSPAHAHLRAAWSRRRRCRTCRRRRRSRAPGSDSGNVPSSLKV